MSNAMSNIYYYYQHNRIYLCRKRYLMSNALQLMENVIMCLLHLWRHS